MTQDVLGVDGYCSRIGTDVDKGTSRALLSLGEYAVCQCQWRQIHFGDTNTCGLETFVEVLIECLALKDIQEVAFETIGLYANGIELELRTYLVFLSGSIENFLILIYHTTVCIHQFDDHVLSDNRFYGKVFRYHVFHAADRLSANTDIDL